MYTRRYVTSLPVDLFQNKIGSGKLMGPKGVSVDRNGHVIVVDNKSCCVFIFQLNGKLVTKFGNRGNGDRQFAGMLSVLSPCSHCPALSPASEMRIRELEAVKIMTVFHRGEVDRINNSD